MHAPTSRSADIFEAAPWRHILPQVLACAQNVPTMLRPEEQQLYFWLTAIWAKGCGEIVDLGCFIGGSTARLALGHLASGLKTKIHAYDRFTVDERTKQKMLYANAIAPFSGHDVLPLAQSLLADWRENVLLYPGEVEDQIWEAGPIEILVMDIAKTADGLDAVSQVFLPNLVAGQSVVVQQDMMHWRQPWIAAQMEMLSDFFEPVTFCPPSTVVFICKQPPPAAALIAAQTAELSDDALIGWVEKSKARLERFGSSAIFDAMIQTIRENPRERTSWRLKKPSAP